ncbi:MAG: hypothetical protein MUF81_19555 [Verrucomicrobia bacterium]|nr:hypothetical protein [Verrucomicrobiota bacterium]
MPQSRPPGTHTVPCLAVDAFGVISTTSFTVTVLLPPRPVLAGCTVAGPGQFQLHGTGSTGLTYTLQISSNLEEWTDHTNVVSDPGGLIDRPMNMETNAPRLLLPPALAVSDLVGG